MIYEVIQEFDHTRAQNWKDIYNITWRHHLSDVSDLEVDENGHQPKRIRGSTRFRNWDYYYYSEDYGDFEDEMFTPYKGNKDENDGVIP